MAVVISSQIACTFCSLSTICGIPMSFFFDRAAIVSAGSLGSLEDVGTNQPTPRVQCGWRAVQGNMPMSPFSVTGSTLTTHHLMAFRIPRLRLTLHGALVAATFANNVVPQDADSDTV
eukprot:m.127884 g.127884  ORF g.127884 m.127884 type:complete len:118 (+) comp22263_c0_seq1:3101-3454(+)